MRDNFDTEDLTKVNTETEFQPEDTFKRGSKYASIFGHPRRGIVMDSIAIRNSSIAFSIDENLKIRLKEIGRISFDAVREDVENYELPIEDSEDLPKTREAVISIRKILNRLINNRIVTSPLTLEIYDSFIDAYETDPSFTPQGEILEMLALTYDCYVQAYLTDISSKPNFWIETSELSQQKHLENFQSLLKWRLKNSFKIGFADKISLFLNLTNIAYGINVGNLIDDYKNNIDSYIQNISGILIKNSLPVPKEIEQNTSSTLNKESDTLSPDIKSLFWNPKAYDYLEEQGEIFDRQISKLMQEFGGKHVVFENGKIIDSDSDEMILLERISKTNFYKERPNAIFCALVPRSLKVNV